MPGHRLVGAGIAALICFAIALAATASAEAQAPPDDPEGTATPAGGTLRDRTLDFQVSEYSWDRTAVQVFYTWDLTCETPPDPGLPTPAQAPVAASTMSQLLRASLEDINQALGGSLVLLDGGLAEPGAHCEETPLFGTNPYDIVVGWAPLAEGVGLSSTSFDHQDHIAGARIFLDPWAPWSCPDAPRHRDVQHTITHELLHALGVDHSEDPSAIMYPSFIACDAETQLQPDDRDALATIYPPTTSGQSPTATPPPASAESYVGLAVTEADTTAPDLIAALLADGCTARVLAITSDGRWVVYVNGAPAFANAAFPSVLAAASPYFYRCA